MPAPLFLFDGTYRHRLVSNSSVPCGCLLIAYLGIPLASGIWDGLPRTLTFEVDSWWNKSWGLDDVDHYHSRCEVAVASEGSRMNRCEYASFHHYILVEYEGKIWNIYRHSDHSGFTVDESRRTAEGGPCSCIWRSSRAPADDDRCTRSAQMRLPNSRLAGFGQVAGYSTVRY